MFGGDQNSKSHLKSHIKDSSSLPVAYKKEDLYSNFHNRANKLVTALYMVTDIMDNEEPLRLRLRNLGTEVISDMYVTSINTSRKIDEIMSFLRIAGSLNMISQMNYGILKKEFEELAQSIENSKHKSVFFGGEETIADFLKNDEDFQQKDSNRTSVNIKNPRYTRIGVQRGSTLMKALSDRITVMSDTNNSINYQNQKKDRREEIVKIIKDKLKDTNDISIGLTITDIRSLSVELLKTSSEKTLQRELVSMVKDGILRKTGDKRWSRYFLNEKRDIL